MEPEPEPEVVPAAKKDGVDPEEVELQLPNVEPEPEPTPTAAEDVEEEVEEEAADSEGHPALAPAPAPAPAPPQTADAPSAEPEAEAEVRMEGPPGESGPERRARIAKQMDAKRAKKAAAADTDRERQQLIDHFLIITAKVAGMGGGVTAGDTCCCVEPAPIQAAFEKDSETLGELAVGEEVAVLEVKAIDGDSRQLRVRSERGWTSMRSATEILLEKKVVVGNDLSFDLHLGYPRGVERPGAVEHFCYPVDVTTVGAPPGQYTFMMTLDGGDRQFGFCRTLIQPDGYQTLCIMTRYPWFSVFTPLLEVSTAQTQAAIFFATRFVLSSDCLWLIGARDTLRARPGGDGEHPRQRRRVLPRQLPPPRSGLPCNPRARERRHSRETFGFSAAAGRLDADSGRRPGFLHAFQGAVSAGRHGSLPGAPVRVPDHHDLRGPGAAEHVHVLHMLAGLSVRLAEHLRADHP